MFKLRKRISNFFNKRLNMLESKIDRLEKKIIVMDNLVRDAAKLEEKVKYIHYELSELRSKMRYLYADYLEREPLEQKQTCESFSHQWKNLLENQNLLSSLQFRETVTDTISAYTQLDKSWFVNKKVLDAGCGQGRFTYGLAKLGAHVVALDQSADGLAYAKQSCSEMADHVKFILHNLLDPLPDAEHYDLVWSFGVLHHTGNTYKAFQNIIKLVKPKGYLFLMLYGEPEYNDTVSFTEKAEYNRLREKTKLMTFDEKINFLITEKGEENVHGWFDAISPAINDTYSYAELVLWLKQAGFENIQRRNDNANHFISAQKAANTL